MAYYWVITVGMLMVIGFFAWTFFYYLRQTLDSDDSKRVDVLPEPDSEDPFS
ncbi:hypothetical protein [Bacillus sp. 2205SS5-2]|uniref:hypothetical protein n=1 Tax=Bacillus sp. 2205SS5-2 TaxID=3109031 RepID=UPI0030062BE0